MLEVKGLGTRLLELVVAFIEEGEIARKIIFAYYVRSITVT